MGPDERWSMDFVHDNFDNRRKFRMLSIVVRDIVAAVKRNSVSKAQ